jgi:F-type H+-transporting ATPase subunit epsilon
MKVSLAIPEKLVFSGVADRVTLIAEKGELTLLDRHADIVTLVKPGKVTIGSSSEAKSFQVSDGVLKIDGDSLSILTQAATAV